MAGVLTDNGKHNYKLLFGTHVEIQLINHA